MLVILMFNFIHCKQNVTVEMYKNICTHNGKNTKYKKKIHCFYSIRINDLHAHNSSCLSYHRKLQTLCSGCIVCEMMFSDSAKVA